ncbi:MAG: hypothetical protein IT463_06755 [Planctomycetes bacterium]|nr:hypothetical protein [Planctomycetota bacterium]
MKFAVLSAIAMTLLVLPALAQDAPAPRKVLLKDAPKAGWSMTQDHEEFSTETTTQSLGQASATAIKETTEKTQRVVEVQELSAEGAITKARVTWPSSTTTVAQQAFGEETMGDPVETDGELKGAEVIWTWDAEKKALTPKVEKGDAAGEELAKHLKKKRPFHNMMLPNREVSVGDTWSPTEEDVKEEWGNNDAVAFKDATITCKAEEILKVDDRECLRVSFSLEINGTLNNEKIGNPAVKFTATGGFFWDIEAGRVASSAIKTEGGFETDVQTPKGAVHFKVELNGSETDKFSYKEAGK